MYEFSELKQVDKDKISRILRRLLAETFIVKNKLSQSVKDREDYNFIKNNLNMLNDMLEPIGYIIKVDNIMEVAMLSIRYDTDENIYSNRLQFGQQKSVLVFILFQYYLKKKGELNAGVVLSNEELDEELRIYNLNIPKKEILENIAILKKHNIVDKASIKDITEPEGEIIIYPSISLSINIDAAEKKYEQIKEAYEKRNSDDEDIINEEIVEEEMYES